MIKCYLLWRDNQESGPYTQEQLEGLGIRPFDLLKPVGMDAEWAYPSQIEEFKTIVQPPEKVDAARESALPLASWLSGALFFLIAGTVWLKGMMQEQIMGPAGSMDSHAGQIRGLPEDAVPQGSPDDSYQNALTIEVVPIDTTQDKIAAGNTLTPLELLGKVQLKGNVEKNSVYGKFNDLILSVHNRSSVLLERVIIKIEFTRLGGKNVKAEQYTVYDLHPKGKRALTIPLSKKDIKVTYQIVTVIPKEYKPKLVLA